MPDNSLNFEKSLEELEKIVNTLENNDISLDKAIELFEKGMELSNTCRKTLEKAETKITALTENKE
ncbi:MAG: exodeoxyribonuclease VII small subunit [Acutalibacteraceae bacterium]|nr:exodeoxyribonuclease VII small subunit [Acutalibacteraceae bacterium]